MAAWMLADERGRAVHSRAPAPVRPTNAAAAKAESPDAAWTAIVRKNAPTPPASTTQVAGTSPLPGGPFGRNVDALKQRAAAGGRIGDIAVRGALGDHLLEGQRRRRHRLGDAVGGDGDDAGRDMLLDLLRTGFRPRRTLLLGHRHDSLPNRRHHGGIPVKGR